MTNAVAVIDIETVGTMQTAGILSIGCVIADLKSYRAAEEFYEPVDLLSQPGRTQSQSTMEWWGKQSKEAFDAAFTGGQSLQLVLVGLHIWLTEIISKRYGRVLVMGNGPEFDNSILGHAFQSFGFNMPWDIWDNQSLRTIVWQHERLFGENPRKVIPFVGTQHHALHDARHEAQALIYAQRKIDSLKQREAA